VAKTRDFHVTSDVGLCGNSKCCFLGDHKVLLGFSLNGAILKESLRISSLSIFR
jgi:hypothetical protein